MAIEDEGFQGDGGKQTVDDGERQDGEGWEGNLRPLEKEDCSEVTYGASEQAPAGVFGGGFPHGEIVPMEAGAGGGMDGHGDSLLGLLLSLIWGGEGEISRWDCFAAWVWLLLLALCL